MLLKFNKLKLIFILCIFANLIYASSYVITNLNDAGTGSLRCALLTQSDNMLIAFQDNLSGTINLQSELPPITAQNVVLSGNLNEFNEPIIVIDASAIPDLSSKALTLSNNTNISNLAIVVGYYGIFIDGDNPTISNCYIGTADGLTATPNTFGVYSSNNCTIQDSLISGNKLINVIVKAESPSTIINHVNIQNNLIGPDKTRYSVLHSSQYIAKNGIEIANFGSNNMSGVNIENNIITGYQIEGIAIVTHDFPDNTLSCNIASNFVTGNKAAEDGIVLLGLSGEISGTITDNTIISNLISGITLYFNVNNFNIQRNRIGILNNNTFSFGNGGSGILLEGSSSATVKNITIGGTNTDDGNIIAYSYFNTLGQYPYGIYMFNQYINNVAILGNSIYANEFSPAISIASGANDNQQAPTIDSLKVDGTNLIISGKSPSISNSNYTSLRLEFFATPIQYFDSNPQGKIFLGAIDSITPSTNFTQNFVLSSSDTPYSITATATAKDNSNNYKETSMFSNSLTCGPKISNFDAFLIEKYYNLLTVVPA